VKITIVVGILLIVLGVIALAYHGITYTTHEKVFQFGPLEATQKKEKTIAFPPLLGGAALAAGILMVVISMGRRPGH